MFRKIKDFFSLIKFSHTVFALPFAFIGFFIAYFEQKPNLKLLFYVVLCMIFARTAAMAFNRYLDRHIDAKNPRTKQREIPAGKIKSISALILTIVMSVHFVVTTFFINRLVFYLSFVALFIILGYSYTKRFTPLCHFILGLGLSLAPIGAYLVVIPIFKLLPILFSLIVFLWVSGFDIIYSVQDYEFDKENNLNSVAVWLGKSKSLVFSSILHVLAAIVLIFTMWYYKFSWIGWLGTIIFVGLLYYQHRIVKPNDLSRVNVAFGTLNGVASIVLAVFLIIDMFVRNS